MLNRQKYIAILLSALLTGSATSSFGEYGDVVLNSKKESMEMAGVKPVVFPHWFHRIRFKCKVCHEDIFQMEKGANDINMGKIMAGEFCGKCHNGVVAWDPLQCDKCHSLEQPVKSAEQKRFQ